MIQIHRSEIDLLIDHCCKKGVKVALNNSWAEGGKGAVDLAKMVLEAVNDNRNSFKPIYELSWSFEKKIETICKLMYGADNVEYALKAKSQLDRIDKLGLGDLAVCIAKTQKSLSDDPVKKRSSCRIYS